MGGRAVLDISAWKVVLRLADMWALDVLRAAAIAQLDAQLGQHEAVERLQLAYAFNLPNWIAPAVKQTIIRRPPLTAADMGLLRPELLASVLAIREVNLFNATHLVRSADGIIQYPLCQEAEMRIEREFGADAKLQGLPDV
jgi:hypothetical protein